MSDSWFGSVASLPLAQARQIEVVCNRFEAAWQTGDPPRIDDFLEGWTGAERFALQSELIALDSEYRGRNGLCGKTTAALPHMVDEANDFPSKPGVAREATIDAPPREGPGCRIGSYQLVEQIGEGGMGTVFLAVQQQPVRRQVALKVIKPGMDSRQVIARFEAERQALALMNHPNIAAVFDAGTTPSGHPYFVMELVKGLPITQYCDEHCLTPKQRLELFMSVCQAVQHAHQKGVIHRDIKPSNVLAALCDGKAVTKVIDFGLAKATGAQLTDQTLSTGVSTMVGTWQYMAPEQTAPDQVDVDTRADIYALGVLLYELLTGSTSLERPRVRQATMLELLRLIRDEEPPKPSTRLSRAAELPRIAAQRGMSPKKLSGLVRGDLDWIVMKCLEKDRDRRYQTADELAADVQRYLMDEPVLARPPSAACRLRKFARRHQTGLAAAMVIGVVVLLAGGGAGWTLWERAAERAHQRIKQSNREAETEKAVTVALAKAENWEAQAKRLPCTTSSNAQVVLAVWKDAVAALAEADAALVTGTTTEPLRQRVQTVVQRILEQQTRTQRKAKLFRELDEAWMACLEWDGTHYDYTAAMTKYAAAFAAYGLDVSQEDVDELARRLRAEEPDLRDTLIVALDNWAFCAASARNAGLATKLLAVAQAADSDTWRRRFREAEAANDRTALRDLSVAARQSTLPPSSVFLLANSLFWHGQCGEALTLLRWGRAQHPTDFWIHFQLAELLRTAKVKTPVEVEETLGCFRAALALNPAATAVHNDLGNSLADAERWDEALAEYKKAIALDPGFAPAHNGFGNCLVTQERWDDAITEYNKAIYIQPNDALYHNNLGVALRGKRQWEAAIAEFKEAIAIQPNFAVAYNNRGIALVGKGLREDAIADYYKAIFLDPELARAYYNRGLSWYAKQQWEDAIADYKKAIALEPNYAPAHNELGNALLAKQLWDAAIAEFRQAIALDHNERNCAMFHNNLGIAQKEKNEWDAAIDEYKKAIALDSKLAPAYYNLGNALQHQQQWDEAIAKYRQAIEVDSSYAEAYCNLGAVYRRQGRLTESLAYYRRGDELGRKRPDWQYDQSPQWVANAERLVRLETKLLDILSGKAEAADNRERLGLLEVCQLQRRNVAAVRLYAEIFKADAAVADDLKAAHRYHAACCAARAAAGQGTDAGQLDDKERNRLRQQALNWLRADLDLWGQRLEKGKPEDRQALQAALAKRQRDADLSSVRDTAALKELPSDQQEA